MREKLRSNSNSLEENIDLHNTPPKRRSSSDRKCGGHDASDATTMFEAHTIDVKSFEETATVETSSQGYGKKRDSSNRYKNELYAPHRMSAITTTLVTTNARKTLPTITENGTDAQINPSAVRCDTAESNNTSTTKCSTERDCEDIDSDNVKYSFGVTGRTRSQEEFIEFVINIIEICPSFSSIVSFIRL